LNGDKQKKSTEFDERNHIIFTVLTIVPKNPVSVVNDGSNLPTNFLMISHGWLKRELIPSLVNKLKSEDQLPLEALTGLTA
jgi:hypothetical protein